MERIGLNSDWILFGRGDMFSDNEAGQELRYRLGLESGLDDALQDDQGSITITTHRDHSTPGASEVFAQRPPPENLHLDDRVVARKLEALRGWTETVKPKTLLPLYLEPVSAGQPEIVEGHIDRYLDVEEWIRPHPESMFALVARGKSMLYDMIATGDVIIVDREPKVKSGMIVVAVLNGELMVKRYQRKGGSIWLLPSNDEFKPIEVTPEMDLEILGVVTKVIHDLQS
jgi:DNA polymerase V